MVELQQQERNVFHRTQKFQDKIKEIFDKRTKPDDFQMGDVVLQWDAPHEERGMNGNFDHLWKGSYEFAACRGKNA